MLDYSLTCHGNQNLDLQDAFPTVQAWHSVLEVDESLQSVQICHSHNLIVLVFYFLDVLGLLLPLDICCLPSHELSNLQFLDLFELEELVHLIHVECIFLFAPLRDLGSISFDRLRCRDAAFFGSRYRIWASEGWKIIEIELHECSLLVIAPIWVED